MVNMSCYIQVCEDENDEPIEIPTEDDNTLLLSTLVAQFPGACGLKYRHAESRSMRGVRLVDGRLHAPDEGWNYVFFCVFPKENKRKSDDHLESSMSKTKRMESKQRCSDLIVLGLPWKTTEKELREYFEPFGEVLMAQVKKDPKTNQSKGFGFIRFGNYETQVRVLSQRHMIDGRLCDVKIPNSKSASLYDQQQPFGANEFQWPMGLASHADWPGMGNLPPREGQVQQVNSKVFIGRCTEDITADDLREYFSKFGEVTDVFIPKPFRAFAFVTFLDPEVAQNLCGEDHIVKGTSVHVSNAAPKSDPNRGPFGRGGRMDGRYGQYGSYGGGMNNGGSWNQAGSRDMPNLAALGTSLGLGSGQGGQGSGQNVNPLNMGALTMPMLAALSQASWGLLGNLQQQNQDGTQAPGYSQGGQPSQGGPPSNPPPVNQTGGGGGGSHGSWGTGGSSGGSWGDGSQGGSWGPSQGGRDKYNRYDM
ncbi:TAR DNA-binding protein 43-like isoform X2 [Portunus trituberculatus]|uniref:TAR DNA-binding protein 43-like isoform X2 n=1 Tax=Portunus trituberculatus TaxID=210409 RepID=UPI001E1CD91A|nr:TAR DNA-binding protein 43-like isoform X2 [Portunus trituberculatus]